MRKVTEVLVAFTVYSTDDDGVSRFESRTYRAAPGDGEQNSTVTLPLIEAWLRRSFAELDGIAEKDAAQD